jgi:hypothetical protein
VLEVVLIAMTAGAMAALLRGICVGDRGLEVLAKTAAFVNRAVGLPLYSAGQVLIALSIAIGA